MHRNAHRHDIDDSTCVVFQSVNDGSKEFLLNDHRIVASKICEEFPFSRTSAHGSEVPVVAIGETDFYDPVHEFDDPHIKTGIKIC